MGCSLIQGPGWLPPKLPQTMVPSLDFPPSHPALELMEGDAAQTGLRDPDPAQGGGP